MDKSNVVKLTSRDTIIDSLTELLRTGTEQLIYQAVEAGFLELLAEHSERRTEDGKAGVVRNGHLPVRELQTGLGPVTVQIPKVRAKSGKIAISGAGHTSAIFINIMGIHDLIGFVVDDNHNKQLLYNAGL